MVRTGLTSFGLIALFLGACGPMDPPPNEQETEMDTIVHKIEDESPYLRTVEEAEEASKDSNFVFIDLRKADEYKMGHIANARSVWRSDIQNTSLPYGGMRAEKETLEELLSSLGVASNHKIIVYDEKGNVDAARLWWMLQLYGHEQSYLFNGGLTGWKEAGYALDTAAPSFLPSQFEFSDAPKSEWLATKEDVLELQSQANGFILDTRSEKEFTGEEMKNGAFRAGHIPSAVWIDYCKALYYDGNQEFRNLEELEELYASAGFTKDAPIIVYCQSGVRSAHTTFVLRELLGYTNVKNYDGSWIEWSYYEELPIEIDTLNKNL